MSFERQEIPVNPLQHVPGVVFFPAHMAQGIVSRMMKHGEARSNGKVFAGKQERVSRAVITNGGRGLAAG